MSEHSVQDHYAGDDTGRGMASRILAAVRAVYGSEVVIRPETLAPLDHFNARGLVCFARKVCHFDSSPLQRQKYASILLVRILLICSNGVDCSLHRGSLAVHRASQARDRTTSVGEKLPIDPKVGRIATKVCREESLGHPKTEKMPPKFPPFLTARVCFRSGTCGKLF